MQFPIKLHRACQGFITLGSGNLSFCKHSYDNKINDSYNLESCPAPIWSLLLPEEICGKFRMGSLLHKGSLGFQTKNLNSPSSLCEPGIYLVLYSITQIGSIVICQGINLLISKYLVLHAGFCFQTMARNQNVPFVPCFENSYKHNSYKTMYILNIQEYVEVKITQEFWPHCRKIKIYICNAQVIHIIIFPVLTTASECLDNPETDSVVPTVVGYKGRHPSSYICSQLLGSTFSLFGLFPVHILGMPRFFFSWYQE